MHAVAPCTVKTERRRRLFPCNSLAPKPGSDAGFGRVFRVQRLIDGGGLMQPARADALISTSMCSHPLPCPLVWREGESFCVAFFPVGTSKQKNRFHLFSLAVLFFTFFRPSSCFQGRPWQCTSKLFPSFPKWSIFLSSEWDGISAVLLLRPTLIQLAGIKARRV